MNESKNRNAELQAVFRLGQMDMREMVVQFLRDCAAESYGVISATLRSAADVISRLEVLNANT